MGGSADAHILGSLASALDTCESGEIFVHAALDRLVADAGLEDALFIVNDRGARRLFRAGWRTPEDFPDLGVRLGEPGLHTVPSVSDTVREAVAAMCRTALRLDVLTHDASHDALTGLFNRRSFDAHLGQALSRADRYGWPFGLALLDLDHFKRINDEHGHHQGDVVLRTIGIELSRSLRGGDVAARVGGDEFALILVDGSPELLSAVLERVSNSVRGTLAGMSIGISAGMAFAPADGSDPDTLYQVADDRLYAAKRR